VDPETKMLEPEYCDVFGVPFEVIPVQGTTARPALPPPPSTLVQALAGRKEMEITFPRVEGYVLDVKQRIRCDLSKVPSVTITPQLEPTEVVIKTQTGWVEKAGRATSIGASETVTREEFYAQHRLQRTQFEIAKEITDKLALKREDLLRLLFPQVLRIVEGYVEKRVRLSSPPQSRKEEIALKKYRDPIVSQLLDAIEPDVEQGESALLPRIERHRPIGSTAQVQFRTTKKTKQTEKSHISHVVLDSNWEGGAQHHLEQCKRVVAYAKNDRLDFEILYEWEGATHKYIPDYLIRIVDEHDRETNLILEIKGLETQQDKAKRAAADKWKRAVNNLPDRPYGTWDYVVCKNPNQLRATLDEYGKSSD
jgi:type III restriction enzyme